MDKASVIEQLNAAKVSHIKWLNRAKALVDGIPIKESAIPVDSTECQFGTWFYGEGQKLNGFANMDCLKVIEQTHFTLHDIYRKIFKIYFGSMERSFLSKLLWRGKKVSAEEIVLAENYLEALENVSKELLEDIEKLERRLLALAANAFENK